MDTPVFTENAAIDHARAFLLKECGVSLPRDDAVLLVYLLAQRGMRDAMNEAREPDAPTGPKSLNGATQALDDLTAEVGVRAEQLEASIGTTVDHCLAILMASVEKSIDEHLERIVADYAVKLHAQTKAISRRKWFWIVMLLAGALCYGAGMVTILIIASTEF